MASCPLARWYHGDGADRRPSFSVLIAPGDISLSHCFCEGCRGTGVFRNVVQLVWSLLGKPERATGLVKAVDSPEVLNYAVGQDEDEDVLTMFFPDTYNPNTSRATKSSKEEAPDPDIDVVNEEDLLREWIEAGVPDRFYALGFTRKDARRWECGTDEFDNRMTFPIRRLDGAVVGATGRKLNDLDITAPPWFHYFGVSTGNYLYGEDKLHAKRKQLKAIVLVEGVTDVIRVDRAIRRSDQLRGFMGAGQFGCKCSEPQIRKLLHFGVPIYFLPDQDDNGQSMLGAEHNAKYARGKVSCFLALLPEGKDPCDATEDEVVEALLDADPF